MTAENLSSRGDVKVVGSKIHALQYFQYPFSCFMFCAFRNMYLAIFFVVTVIDMKKDNGGKAEGFYTSGQMQKSKRNGLRKYRGNQ